MELPGLPGLGAPWLAQLWADLISASARAKGPLPQPPSPQDHRPSSEGNSADTGLLHLSPSPLSVAEWLGSSKCNAGVPVAVILGELGMTAPPPHTQEVAGPSRKI